MADQYKQIDQRTIDRELGLSCIAADLDKAASGMDVGTSGAPMAEAPTGMYSARVLSNLSTLVQYYVEDEDDCTALVEETVYFIGRMDSRAAWLTWRLEQVSRQRNSALVVLCIVVFGALLAAFIVESIGYWRP